MSQPTAAMQLCRLLEAEHTRAEQERSRSRLAVSWIEYCQVLACESVGNVKPNMTQLGDRINVEGYNAIAQLVLCRAAIAALATCHTLCVNQPKTKLLCLHPIDQLLDSFC